MNELLFLLPVLVFSLRHYFDALLNGNNSEAGAKATQNAIWSKIEPLQRLIAICIWLLKIILKARNLLEASTLTNHLQELMITFNQMTCKLLQGTHRFLYASLPIVTDVMVVSMGTTTVVVKVNEGCTIVVG